MPTDRYPIGVSNVDGAAIRRVPESNESVANDYRAWLDQATKVRDTAFRILQDRFNQDVADAAQLVGGIDPHLLASQMEFATKLTADYLAESEKMFELMRTLAQDGLLETRQDHRGPLARRQGEASSS